MSVTGKGPFSFKRPHGNKHRRIRFYRAEARWRAREEGRDEDEIFFELINEFEGDDEEEADADQGLDGDVFDEHQIISRGWKFYDAYDYVSPTGVVLYQMRRYHHSLVPKLKKFVAIRPDNSAGVHCDPDEVVRWLVGNGGLSVIYNWREITMLKDDVVHVFEGEKNAKRGISLGLLGTTVAGQTWTETAAEALRGRDVIIYQDNDEPGRKNTFNAVEALTDLAKTIRVVRLPGLAHKNDFSDWMDAGHTLEELEAVIAAAPVFGLTEFFNVDVLDGVEVPLPQWSVVGHVPLDQVTLLSGHGAIGKSLALLQEWLGLTPVPGPVMFIDAENSTGIIHKRLKDILDHYGAKFSDFKGNLYVRSLAGMDATMAVTTSKSGKIEPTALYRQLVQNAREIKPVMIGIASSANVFAGNENDRSQVQQFITMLTHAAMTAHCSVVLISHPSLTGLQSDSGLSGSTAWYNSVRAQMYLKAVKETKNIDRAPANDQRIIEFRKNQYGPPTQSIILRYHNGVFVPVVGTTADQAERNQAAEDMYMDVLRHLIGQNQDLSL